MEASKERLVLLGEVIVVNGIRIVGVDGVAMGGVGLGLGLGGGASLG